MTQPTYAIISTYPQEGSQNVGDALITHSCKRFIQAIKGPVTFVDYWREDELAGQLPEVNSTRAVLFPGFAIRSFTWPSVYRLSGNLAEIQPPLIAIGAGMRLSEKVSLSDAYDSTLDEQSRAILDRIQNDSGVIACRETFTQASLSAAGYDTMLMGDCALFDPDLIGQPVTKPKGIARIAFTAPRSERFLSQATDIISALRATYPGAELVLIRHGIPTDTEQAVEDAGRLPLLDAYGSDPGVLALYNDFDLHIGYRVHAHLYRLRTRRPSILIEEDSRAIGFGRTLALEGVRATPQPNLLATLPPHRAARRVVRRWIPRASETSPQIVRPRPGTSPHPTTSANGICGL